MTYTISPDRRTLTIHASESERKALRQMPDGDEQGCGSIGTDLARLEFFGPLIANSELEWIYAVDTGATGT